MSPLEGSHDTGLPGLFGSPYSTSKGKAIQLPTAIYIQVSIRICKIPSMPFLHPFQIVSPKMPASVSANDTRNVIF